MVVVDAALDSLQVRCATGAGVVRQAPKVDAPELPAHLRKAGGLHPHRGGELERVYQFRNRHLRRVLDEQMQVVVLAIAFPERGRHRRATVVKRGLKMLTDAIGDHTTAVLGRED